MTTHDIKDKFNIGFEFECVGPKGTPTFSGIRRHLRKSIGEDWIDHLRIEDDDSIRHLKSYEKEGRACCELITRPLLENEAIDQLEAILMWMQQYCKTDYTCGLHVNMSFAKREMNSRVSYPLLVQRLPQREILKLFDRTTNKYCLEISLNERIDYLLRTASVDFFEVKSYSFKKLLNILNLSDQDLAKAYRRGLINILDNMMTTHLQRKDKAVFVADRNTFSKTKRYFEFRPIGNVDYQFRVEEILYCIDTFKDAMRHSVV
jgi:hypothetical protein